jgi:hypothetical protein
MNKLPAQVHQRKVAQQGFVWGVDGEVESSTGTRVSLPLFCRTLEVLTDGVLVAADAFVDGVAENTESELVLLRSFARPLGRVTFKSGGLKVEALAEDSWMRTSEAEAHAEIAAVRRLPTAAIESELTKHTLLTLSARVRAYAAGLSTPAN